MVLFNLTFSWVACYFLIHFLKEVESNYLLKWDMQEAVCLKLCFYEEKFKIVSMGSRQTIPFLNEIYKWLNSQQLFKSFQKNVSVSLNVVVNLVFVQKVDLRSRLGSPPQSLDSFQLQDQRFHSLFVANRYSVKTIRTRATVII